MESDKSPKEPEKFFILQYINKDKIEHYKQNPTAETLSLFENGRRVKGLWKGPGNEFLIDNTEGELIKKLRGDRLNCEFNPVDLKKRYNLYFKKEIVPVRVIENHYGTFITGIYSSDKPPIEILEDKSIIKFFTEGLSWTLFFIAPLSMTALLLKNKISNRSFDIFCYSSAAVIFIFISVFNDELKYWYLSTFGNGIMSSLMVIPLGFIAIINLSPVLMLTQLRANKNVLYR